MSSLTSSRHSAAPSSYRSSSRLGESSEPSFGANPRLSTPCATTVDIAALTSIATTTVSSTLHSADPWMLPPTSVSAAPSVGLTPSNSTRVD